MEAGDTVFFHPLLLHGSGPNMTQVSLFVFSIYSQFAVVSMCVKAVIFALFLLRHYAGAGLRVNPVEDETIWNALHLFYAVFISCVLFCCRLASFAVDRTGLSEGNFGPLYWQQLLLYWRARLAAGGNRTRSRGDLRQEGHHCEIFGNTFSFFCTHNLSRAYLSCVWVWSLGGSVRWGENNQQFHKVR